MIVFPKRTVVLTVLFLLSIVIVSHARNDLAAVQTMSVDSNDGFVEVSVNYSEEVQYTYFRLDGPRLVVDFHNAENQLEFEDRAIGEGGVQRIRTSFFSDATREATRVVFDLEAGTDYSVVEDTEGRLRVRFTGVSPQVPVELASELGAEFTDEPSIPKERSVTDVFESSVPMPRTLEDIPADRANDELLAEGGTRGPALDEPIAEVPLQVASLQSQLPPGLVSEPAASRSLESEPVGAEGLGGVPQEELEPVEPLAISAASVGTVSAERAPLEVVAAPAQRVEALVEGRASSSFEPVVALPEPSALAAAPVGPPSPRPAPAGFLGQVVEPTATPQYSGELVSFDFRGLDIRDFFRTIAEISGLNVVLDPGVSGQVNLYLIDVPWDQGLDVVLRTHNLGYELQGNVLRVATQATLQAEEDDRRALRDAQELNAQLVTRSFILSYSQAATMSPVITELLSARGTIITDTRRNALIITDIDSRFERLEGLISFLDMPAQQVEIEARLLSANKSFSRDLGSQIGLIVGNNSQNNLTGLPTNPSPFDRTPPPAVTAGGGSALPLVSSFPIASGTAGLSFLLGVGGDVLLDSIIAVAEARGTAKLLSRPRVTTQNNQVATVEQGTQIPVQTNVNNTVTTQFIQFALKLDVTPQITEAGTILLTAEIENSTPDFSRAVLGIPSVSTQLARTQVLIPDGGTAVIGGILVDSDSVNVRQIPGLGSIPVLGNLFKSTETARNTSELLFFITARIKPANPLEFLSDTTDEQSSFSLPPEGTGGTPGEVFVQQ